MARALAVLVLFAPLALAAPDGNAANAEALRKAEDLLARAKALPPKEGVPLAREALALREDALGPGDRLVGDALVELAWLLHRAGEEEEALRGYRRAAGIYEERLGPADDETLSLLSLLAGQCFVLRRFEESLAVSEKALGILSAHGRSEDPSVVDALLGTTNALLALGRLDPALVAAVRCVALCEKIDGPGGQSLVLALGTAALVRSARGEHPEALALARRSLSIQEAAYGPEDPRLVSGLGFVAAQLGALGDPEAALDIRERIAAILTKAVGPEHPRTVGALSDVAGELASLGRLKEARGTYERVVAVRAKALGPDHRETATAKAKLADVLMDLGRYEEARVHLADVLAVRERSLGPADPLVLRATLALAKALEELGRYEEGRPLLERAISGYEKAGAGESFQYGLALFRLGFLLHRQGRAEEAAGLLARAHAVLGRTAPQDLPAGLVAQFRAYDAGVFEPARIEEALALNIRHEELTRKLLGSNHPEMAVVLRLRARLYHRAGRPEEARALYERARVLVEGVLGPDHVEEAEVLSGLALLDLQAGRLDAARPLAERALAIREASLGPAHPDVAKSLDLLALVHEAAGEWKAAGAARLRGLELTEASLRRYFVALTPLQRLGLVGSLRLHLDRWLAIAPRLSRTGYEEVLRLKCIATRAAAEEVALGRAAGPGTAALVADLTAAERRLSRLANALAAAGPGERGRAVKDYAAAAAERESLALDLQRELAVRRAGRAAAEAGIGAVQAALGEGQVLVDYLRTGDGYVAFLVGRKGDVVRLDLGPATTIDEAAARFAGSLAGPGGRGLRVEGEPEAPPAPGEAGNRLRSLVFDPVAVRLPPDTSTLVLSPDAALAAVPFAALPGREMGRFLGEDFLLAHVPAALDLIPDPAAPERGAGFLLLGGVDYGEAGQRGERFAYLPGTLLEVEFLRGVFGGDCTTLTGAKATEAELRRTAPGRRVLHLATHGFTRREAGPVGIPPIDESDPITAGEIRQLVGGGDPLLLGGLALAGANRGDGGEGDDGILTALEALRLDLRGVEVVVLSACQTSTGRVEGGEGVIGLTQAFRAAGAASVLGSLWKVDDAATRALMEAFHSARSWPGLGSAGALRAAQAAVRGRPEWRHPSFWAAFTVWGPPD